MKVNGREVLIALYLKHRNWDKIYRDIILKKEIEKRYLSMAKRVENKYITLLDPDYPEDIKKRFRPPFVIRKK